MTFSETSPLPMRYPATNPPVAGDHFDIGVWPNGWRFMSDADAERFNRVPDAERAVFLRSFDAQAAMLAER